MNLTSPSVLWIDCSRNSSWTGMADFGDGKWSNVQMFNLKITLTGFQTISAAI
jgi:hypothetical protein